jgi:hypothetical protein
MRDDDTGIALRISARIRPAGRCTDRAVRMPGTIVVVMKSVDDSRKNEKQGKKKYCSSQTHL